MRDDQQLLGVAIIAAYCVHHHLGRHEAHPLSARLEPAFAAAAGVDFFGQRFCHVVENGKVGALSGHEQPRLGHRVAAGIVSAGIALFYQRALLAHVGGVEP